MLSRFETIITVPECDRRTGRHTDILRQHSPRYAQRRAVKTSIELTRMVLADSTSSRAYSTVLRPSVVCLSVCRVTRLR